MVKLPLNYFSSKDKKTFTWVYICSFLVSWFSMVFTDRNNSFGLKSVLWSDFAFAVLLSPASFLLGCVVVNLVEDPIKWLIKRLKSK